VVLIGIQRSALKNFDVTEIAWALPLTTMWGRDGHVFPALSIGRALDPLRSGRVL
jgi:hypothetical protein